MTFMAHDFEVQKTTPSESRLNLFCSELFIYERTLCPKEITTIDLRNCGSHVFSFFIRIIIDFKNCYKIHVKNITMCCMTHSPNLHRKV